MQKAKSFEISKHLIWQAFQKVKENKGSGGIDGVELDSYEKDVKNNLYKLWNRMSSGSYFPKPVKLVEIPKAGGGMRPLGIPTIEDRVAQMATVLLIEPLMEPHFHENSYGYRPGKSAHQALEVARRRCWSYNWVVDLDISKYFDTIDHELLMKAVEKHTDIKWVLLYIRRWLIVPYKSKNGKITERSKGVPQGSVIGPLLSNLFLHYAFDEWMKRSHGHIPFERYVDDAICHCRTEPEARGLKDAIKRRFAECKLELNETKTRIVYCKDAGRKENHCEKQFDFLGYTFRPRLAVSKSQQYFVSFLPAISTKARKKISQEMRSWWVTSRTDKNLQELASEYNPVIRGWLNYYGKFYKSALSPIFKRLNERLAIWVTKKFKRFRGHRKRAKEWLGEIAEKHRIMFAHWNYGILPSQVQNKQVID